MGLINRILRRSERPRFSREALESEKNAGRQDRNRQIAVKTIILVSLTAITVLAFQRGPNLASTVEVGDAWQRETLAAPFDFAILKSEDSLEAERNRIRYTTAPIFSKNPNVAAEMQANHESVARQLDEVFGAYKDWRINEAMALVAAENRDSVQFAAFRAGARRDSTRFVDLRRNARVKLSDAQWTWLGDDFVTRSPDLPDDRRSDEVGRPQYEALLDAAFNLGRQFNARGVLNIPLDSVFTDDVIVRDVEASTFETVRKYEIFDLNEVYQAMRSEFGDEVPVDSGLGTIPTKLVQAVFVPSLRYERGATVRKWQEAQRFISPTRGKVSEGEIIVREGEEVSLQIRQKLASLDFVERGRRVSRLQWKRTAAEIILALSTFAIFFLYLFMARRSIFDDNRKMLLVALMYAGIIGLFAVAIRLDAHLMYAVPVVIVSVLLTVIFDSRVGLFGTLALALLGGLILGFDYAYFYATLFGGTLGVFSVRDIRNRSQFFLSAAFAFAGYAVAMVGTWLFLESSTAHLLSNLLMAGISSFLLIMAYPLLWIFERTFDIATDLRLLELSDTNRPLLKDLSLRAPGTFNHSLQMANIAEAAASAIGANALLTRVGALYHDTGKMVQPEYFVENQRQGVNPHDELPARESARIIRNHVRHGLELGIEAGLPQRVLDFIPTHHGTTRIEYFYRKAQQEEGEDVDMEPFRYGGPRPTSRETAILMLADGTEAASRSLDDPTPEHLAKLIDHIFQVRLRDGQLDDAQVTLGDLNRIKETFQTLLSGIYHVRVKYPGQPEER